MDSEQIRERAIAASNEILQRIALDSRGPSKKPIGEVLSTSAQFGLLNLNFLESPTTVGPDDMRQAAASIETLASQLD